MIANHAETGEVRGERQRTAGNTRVAVIGGGLAGLVAARDLALAGARVTLFEGSDRLGGRVHAVQLAGAPFDVGAEAFATRGGSVAALLTELGITDRVVQPANLGAWVVGDAGPLPLPPGGAIGIPAKPLAAAARKHLGWLGAVRAAAEPLMPRARNIDGDTTVADAVRSRLGERVLQRLVRPITLGVYSAEPERLPLAAVSGLSAAYARTGSLVLAARELREASVAAGGAVASLAGGMTTLVSVLAETVAALGCDIVLGASVDALSKGAAADAPWQLMGGGGEPIPGSGHFDAVLLAVPESAARALLQAAAPAAAPASSREAAAPAEHDIEVIALAIDDDRLDAAPRGTGVLVAAGAGIAAKALTHVTAKWPDRAATVSPGTHVLRLSYGRAGSAPETADLDPAAALALAHRDAAAILGMHVDADRIVGWERQRWHVGAPPGASPRLTVPPRAALAGDWVSGTGLASVIPGARAAAAGLLRETAHITHNTSRNESPVSPA